MTVYADTLFLINSIFNAEILLLLCRVFLKKIPVMRLILSAMLGGIFGVIVFVPYAEALARPPANFILPSIMVFLVFGKQKIRGFLEQYISFLALSFILSGAVSFFGLSGFLGMLLPIPIYFAICILRKNIRKKKGEVILEYKDKSLTVEGFFDSGNMLLSGSMPVILGNDKVFKGLFECDFSNRNIGTLSEKFEMRIIPFVSLGKAGTVLGVKLNRILVDGKEYNDVVLAYAGDNFAEDLVLNSIMT